MIGPPCSRPKSWPLASCRIFLGTVCDASQHLSEGVLTFAVNDDVRRDVLQTLHRCLSQRKLSRSEAGRVRGKLGWLASGLAGRCGRLGVGPLICRQYYDSTDDLSPSTPALYRAVHFLIELLEILPPRSIPVTLNASSPIILYTDASYEPGIPPRIGFVCYDSAVPLLAGTAVLSQELLAEFLTRENQICPAEAIAPLLPLELLQPELRCRDLIWFCDNAAVCGAMVKRG